MFLSELIPLSEALAILGGNQKVMETEIINLEDSYLRVLAKEIYSLHDSPPFDKSAMDGYAVKAEDTFGASSNVVKNLKIIDQIGAGDFSTKELKEGEAIKIATGAPIPDGANAVLMEEYTVSDGENLEIHSQVTPNDNIAFCGEDLKKGDKVAKSCTIIRPQEMGLIASAGFNKIEVYKKPNVKLIITGNELVEPSPKLEKAQTINSNKYTISAMIKSTGADIEIEHSQDNFYKVREAILNGTNDYDLVITTGGTAISKGDVVIDAVDDIGEVLIHGVALRPGKPFGFGIVNNTPVFMLSGYPVAAMGQFDALVRQYLFKMQNILYNPKVEKRIATLKIFSNLGRTDYVRTFSDDKNTKYVLNRGSGIIRSMVEANSYVIIDENQEGVAKGDWVDVLFFDNMNWNK
ncbi:MAG: molybdopterin molybdotransferase MoeA [Methanobacteriaceae archaeon]|jgi:molybdopterin molybdotransferase|nr:molybdopterin molybdotransferase MoeA [Candidatus Methanorudis spinitermitis]